MMMTPDLQWQAVLTRDIRANGRFVYAVRSTRIYCRPTCASRRPRRSSVVFFSGPDAAERAGYRPCRRCRPAGAGVDPAVEKIRRVCEHIARNPDERPTLAMLARVAGLSAFHFQRTFKRLMGISPREYAQACRVRRLKARLKEGGDVTSAMYEAGYGSSSRLYESAPDTIGMTPATYRRGGLGARVRYTIVDSAFGRVLVGATDRGVCAVSLGTDDLELEKWLREEYPRAEISRDDGRLRIWIRSLLDHLAGRQPHLDLPVDVRASAFQWRVWQQLQTIPYGQTRSYAEIAQALGRPTAARAVARACATNPVSIAIPCHRVVRGDGSLGGYRWGSHRKQALLAEEKRRLQR